MRAIKANDHRELINTRPAAQKKERPAAQKKARPAAQTSAVACADSGSGTRRS